MADDIDRASEREALATKIALQQQEDSARQTEAAEFVDGVQVCIDCLERILPARLALVPSCVRCISCQEDFEFIKRRDRGRG